MKRAFLYLIIIFWGIVVNGQTINLDSIFGPKLSGEIYQKKTGMMGKQFYNDDWTESDIKLSSGELAVNKLLMYNELMDEVIWLQADSFRQIKLEKHFIDEFCFKNYNGKSVRFKRIKAKLPSMMDSTDIFVEVLCEKTASLYVFRNVRINGNINSVEDGVLYSYDKLVPQPVYILILPDKKTITFKTIRRGVLLKALPEEYKTTVKEIIQQNYLPVRSENDLIKLVNLIN
jgi:hypothetical protein